MSIFSMAPLTTPTRCFSGISPPNVHRQCNLVHPVFLERNLPMISTHTHILPGQTPKTLPDIRKGPAPFMFFGCPRFAVVKSKRASGKLPAPRRSPTSGQFHLPKSIMARGVGGSLDLPAGNVNERPHSRYGGRCQTAWNRVDEERSVMGTSPVGVAPPSLLWWRSQFT